MGCRGFSNRREVLGFRKLGKGVMRGELRSIIMDNFVHSHKTIRAGSKYGCAGSTGLDFVATLSLNSSVVNFNQSLKIGLWAQCCMSL